jgi:hypothetical protein
MTMVTTVPPTKQREKLFSRGRSGRMVALGVSRADQHASREQVEKAYEEAHQTTLKTIRRHREELLGSS